MTPAGAQETPGNDNLWALVRQGDGDMEVVHGDDALEAVWNDNLNWTADTVLSLETDKPVSSLATSDPMRSQQWALNATSYEATWSTTRGSGVTVAVIDTGVRGDHEDLSSVVLPGVDFVQGTDGRIDPNGHGTHVAGIIAAQTDNGHGIAGGAPDVRILPVRVLDANGSGNTSNVAAGIIWATDHGARVINMSLGGGASQGMHDAVAYAVAHNVVVVAAAGNNGDGAAPVYPGAYDEAIAVAAVDSNRNRASFSNTGSYVDISAPGVSIVSTYGSAANAYASMSGTSMATPYAAAAAALVVAAKPSASAADVRSYLLGSADDLGAAGFDNWYGNGLVDPRDAVSRAVAPTPGTSGNGYWIVDRDGEVHPFGNAQFLGQPKGLPGLHPIVAAARTASGNGYWVVADDGAVYAYGDAPSFGGMNGRGLNQPIVAMAPTRTGQGYYLLARDGGVFAFGDAVFVGSTGGIKLNSPILDLAVSSTGNGYWFVGGDGGVFSFGSAAFYGSTGGLKLAAPVMSMTAKASGDGYWMIGYDGGVFAFGAAPFHGSLPGLRAAYGPMPPAIRMRALSDGTGYYVLGFGGSVYTVGNAKFWGSAPGDAVDLMLMP
jgi:type VII secretion-associated serine protease mycosin